MNDLEDIMLSKPVRERKTPYDFTYLWNLKNNINKQNRSRLIATENRLTVFRGEGVGQLWEKREEIKQDKLIVTE